MRLDFGGVDTPAAARALELAASSALGDDEFCAIVELVDAAERLQRAVLAAGPQDGSRGVLCALDALVDSVEVPTECRKGLLPKLDMDARALKDSASDELRSARARERKHAQKLRSLLGAVAPGLGEIVEAPGGGGRLALRLPTDAVTADIEKTTLVIGVDGRYVTLEPRAAAGVNAKLADAHAAAEAAARRARDELARTFVQPWRGDLRRCLDLIASLDVICAKASYASASGAMRPTLVDLLAPADAGADGDADGTDGPPLALDVRHVVHPLLQEAYTAARRAAERSRASADAQALLEALEEPVPLDLKVESGVCVVTITGPNAGGKTAALKTLGLCAVMARAGMFPPGTGMGVFGAEYAGPRVPFFACVLADVGDSQSIAESLSTFTARVTRTAAAMRAAADAPPALVLLDEVGAGTDPLEGAALGAALLRGLAGRLAGGYGMCVATTHHGELTALKYDLGETVAENASMEWDEAGERPTYRVLWGVPGRSRGLAVARRIGVDPGAIEDAEALVGAARARADTLVEQMETERARVHAAQRRVQSCSDAAAAARARAGAARDAKLASEAVHWRAGRKELEAAALKARIKLKTMAEVRRSEAVAAGDESALEGLSKAKQRKLKQKIKAARSQLDPESAAPQEGIVGKLMAQQREKRMAEDLNLSELRMRRFKRQQAAAAAAAGEDVVEERERDEYSALLDAFGSTKPRQRQRAKSRAQPHAQQAAQADAADVDGSDRSGDVNPDAQLAGPPGGEAAPKKKKKTKKKGGGGGGGYKAPNLNLDLLKRAGRAEDFGSAKPSTPAGAQAQGQAAKAARARTEREQAQPPTRGDGEADGEAKLLETFGSAKPKQQRQRRPGPGKQPGQAQAKAKKKGGSGGGYKPNLGKNMDLLKKAARGGHLSDI